MSQQLVLSTNSAANYFRWCWLQDGQPQSSASGNLEALRQAIGELHLQAWLLLPGVQVITRELEYNDKEKKHLRNLVPYQLEDSVAADIDDLHFALGEASKGRVVVSYTDKSWLRNIFQQLTAIGLEITRCWSAPTLLPLTLPAQAEVAAQENGEPQISAVDADLLEAPASATWVLALQGESVNLRFNEQQGFTLPKAHLAIALGMLLEQQGLSENLPQLVLRANSEEELATLYGLLPDHLAARVVAQNLVDEWALDFDGRAIDLCQAEFSQRLPLERWLKMWRSVGILALVTLVVYIAVLSLHISKLNKENLSIRQQTEAAFRTVVPHGPSDDPERKLRNRLADMQPKAQTGSVVKLLAGVLPVIASNPDLAVKLISYTADNGEMSVNLQTHAFSSIDALQKNLEAQGYHAELLSSNAQGDLNTARLKISKPLN
ncbi:MAG TPA: type II secretion system protein GspL [Cellvibrio sp.]|nr:type II secretion system protein GspL [Cellvibrio sp.]